LHFEGAAKVNDHGLTVIASGGAKLCDESYFRNASPSIAGTVR
jgi:hypothetical protein